LKSSYRSFGGTSIPSFAEWKQLRRVLDVLGLFLLLTVPAISQHPHRLNPASLPTTVVVQSTRFQFLTPSLVRLEFSPSRSFVDAPTAVVLGRKNWKSVKVAKSAEHDWLTMKTDKMSIRYLQDNKEFSRENLQITWKDKTGKHTWSPGDSDDANLGGIARSLDGARKGRLPRFLPGILSRNGYFLLDDSRTPVRVTDSDWIAPRSETGNQDWYFFVYGNNYAGVLKEYSELCGPIPMIPRYTLGAWVTDLNYEYLPGTAMIDKFNYRDSNVQGMINHLRADGFPVDVLVLDFAWHNFGWKGGYDWSPIFPKPEEFLKWAHNDGLRITLNDHPGYGRESVLSSQDRHAGEVRSQLHITEPEKPKFSIDLTPGWKFSLDSTGIGMQRRWFAADFNDTAWITLRGAASWEDQGFPDYDGIAWYRKWVTLPTTLQYDSLYLLFGGVDDEYDLFVNGIKVGHYGTPGSSVYSTLTWKEISSFARPGENVLITLRVNDWGGDGGITNAPVALTDRLPGQGIRFNLSRKKDADVFMNVLHNPLIDQGVDFWWVDGGAGSCEMDGLNSQMWTNKIFYDFTQDHTNKRGFIFSRYGGWGSHRYPALFTGDTYAQWDVLSAEIPYTAQGGNVLMPYITHDIGGFIGSNISPDLYVRWVQFGAFSPFLRLHCAHENPEVGNRRMPWIFGARAENIARDFFRLRYRMLPYIYTMTRVAHDSSLPVVRPLYLQYPALEEAYHHPDEYFFGNALLVSPVTDSLGRKDVYLPPGQWFDYFSGEQIEGNRTIHRTCSLETVPVFVRSGSIVPLQQDMAYSDQRVLDTLTLDIYGRNARFTLYEDDGITLQEERDYCAFTPLVSTPQGVKGSHLTIGPTKGSYKRQVNSRTYEIHIHGMTKPQLVRINGIKMSEGDWNWESSTSVLTVHTRPLDIRKRIDIVIE